MSIPFWQPPPTPDYSAQMGNTVNLVGAVKDYQAKNALQNIYQNAIDPQTGAFDQQKFNLGVRNSPAALWNAGKEMEQSGQAQEAMGRGTVAQTQAYRSQLDNMAGVYADIANSPVKVPPAILQQRLDREYQSGGVNSQYYQAASKVISNMDPNEDGRELAREQLLINQDAKTRLDVYTPGYGSVDTGSAILRTQEKPWLPGYGEPVGIGYQKTPAPGDVVEMTIDKGPLAGQTIKVPATDAIPYLRQGWRMVLQGAGGGGGGSGGGGTANPNINIGSGRQHPETTTTTAQGDQGVPVVGGGTVQIPPPKPAVPSAVSPQTTTPAPAASSEENVPIAGVSMRPGFAGNVAASTADFNASRDRASSASTRILTAQQALNALQGAVTGPGTDFVAKVNDIVGSYQQYAPDWLKSIFAGTGLDPNQSATNRAEAQKYLTQIALGQADSMGRGTDQQLLTAITGNPSIHIQNAAAQDVLKAQIGLERMNQMLWREAQGQGIDEAHFATWKANWMTDHDLRVFVADSMTPDQRKRLHDELYADPTGPATKRFLSSARQAYAGGYIPNILASP